MITITSKRSISNVKLIKILALILEIQLIYVNKIYVSYDG